MNNHAIKKILLVFSLATLTGCGILPGSGPSVSDISASSHASPADLRIEKVTIPMAKHMLSTQSAAYCRTINKEWRVMSSITHPVAVRLLPGDAVRVRMWYTDPLSAWSSNGGASALKSVNMGGFIVDSHGAINLPYAPNVVVRGMSLLDAEQAIDARYQESGRFDAPDVVLTMRGNVNQRVFLGGDVKKPAWLNLDGEPMSLSAALVRTGGIRFHSSTSSRSPTNRAARKTVQVTFHFPGHQPAVRMPLSFLMRKSVVLLPGTRVLFNVTTRGTVTLLGAGVHDTIAPLREGETLAEALSAAGGLVESMADDHSIFVMRKTNEDGSSEPVRLYDFAWNHVQGLIAADYFPLQSGDVVYVSAAPEVRMEKVVQLLFQMAYPITAVKTMGG